MLPTFFVSWIIKTPFLFQVIQILNGRLKDFFNIPYKRFVGMMPANCFAVPQNIQITENRHIVHLVLLNSSASRRRKHL